MRANDGAGDHCGPLELNLARGKAAHSQGELASSPALEKVLEVGSCHKQRTFSSAEAEVRGGLKGHGTGQWPHLPPLLHLTWISFPAGPIP